MIFPAKEGKPLLIGGVGENDARRIQFDITEWIRSFGSGGTVYVLHQRSGDTAPYACKVERKDQFAEWVVSDTDVAVAGKGKAELQYVLDGVIAKSMTFVTLTRKTMSQPGDTPSAYDGWIENVLVPAQKAAEEAENATKQLNSVGEELNSAVQDATELNESLNNLLSNADQILTQLGAYPRHYIGPNDPGTGPVLWFETPDVEIVEETVNMPTYNCAGAAQIVLEETGDAFAVNNTTVSSTVTEAGVFNFEIT